MTGTKILWSLTPGEKFRLGIDGPPFTVVEQTWTARVDNRVWVRRTAAAPAEWFFGWELVIPE